MLPKTEPFKKHILQKFLTNLEIISSFSFLFFFFSGERFMGKLEARKNIYFDQQRVADHHRKAQNERFVIMESCDDRDHEDNICDSGSMESSQENSTNSIGSSSSSDLVEDASSTYFKSSSSSSSSSPPSSSSSNGPLYELSELMVHLPLRRGLSKFYQGKSQSFTSLSSVKSLEDLPKKIAPFKKKLMKSCKSYGGGLDGTNKLHYPRAIISKKSSRGSNFFSSLGSFRPSAVVQKNCFDHDQRSNPV